MKPQSVAKAAVGFGAQRSRNHARRLSPVRLQKNVMTTAAQIAVISPVERCQGSTDCGRRKMIQFTRDDQNRTRNFNAVDGHRPSCCFVHGLRGSGHSFSKYVLASSSS